MRSSVSYTQQQQKRSSSSSTASPLNNNTSSSNTLGSSSAMTTAQKQHAILNSYPKAAGVAPPVGGAGPTPHLARKERSERLAATVGTRVERVQDLVPRVVMASSTQLLDKATAGSRRSGGGHTAGRSSPPPPTMAKRIRMAQEAAAAEAQQQQQQRGGGAGFPQLSGFSHPSSGGANSRGAAAVNRQHSSLNNSSKLNGSGTQQLGGGGGSFLGAKQVTEEEEDCGTGPDSGDDDDAITVTTTAKAGHSKRRATSTANTVTTHDGTTLYNGVGYINSVVDRPVKDMDRFSRTVLVNTTGDQILAAVACEGARHLNATSNHWVKVHQAKEENFRLRSTQKMVGLSLMQQLQESHRQHDTATGYTQRHSEVNQRRMEIMEEKLTGNYEKFLINTNKREVAKHCHASRLLNARATEWAPLIQIALTSQLMMRALRVRRAKDTLRRLFINRALAYLRRKKMLVKRREQIRVHEEALVERPPNDVLRQAIPALTLLPDALITKISEKLTRKCYLAAEFITYAGEPGDTCFILGIGVVECTSLTSEAVSAIGGGHHSGGGSGSNANASGNGHAGGGGGSSSLSLLQGHGGGGAGNISKQQSNANHHSNVPLSHLPQTDLSEAVDTFRLSGKGPSLGAATLQRKWTVLCRSILLTMERYEHTFRAHPRGPGADFWIIQHSTFAAVCDAFFAENAKMLKALMAEVNPPPDDDNDDDGASESASVSSPGGQQSNPTTAKGKGAGMLGGRAGGKQQQQGKGGDFASNLSSPRGGANANAKKKVPALSAAAQQQMRQLESVMAARDWHLRSIDGRRELNMFRYHALTSSAVRRASALFQHWSPEGIAGIIAKARPIVYRRDDIVVREGKYGKTLLIVVAGRLEMLQGDGRRVEVFQSGSCVADIASATGIRNPAVSVVALSNADVWQVDHKDVEALAIREDQNIFMATVLAAVDEHGEERTVRHSVPVSGLML